MMQQGLEMLAWITTVLGIKRSGGPTFQVLDSPIKRWVTQYATQVYVVVGDLNETYIEYLVKGTVPGNRLDPHSFLKLRLLGPFSIYSAEEMRLFGFLWCLRAIKYATRHITLSLVYIAR
ncbi:hypothetical protein ACN38_g12877, partial [Penicillium nordicum]